MLNEGFKLRRTMNILIERWQTFRACSQTLDCLEGRVRGLSSPAALRVPIPGTWLVTYPIGEAWESCDSAKGPPGPSGRCRRFLSQATSVNQRTAQAAGQQRGRTRQTRRHLQPYLRRPADPPRKGRMQRVEAATEEPAAGPNLFEDAD